MDYDYKWEVFVVNQIMEIAARIRELREICGYSREELAKELGIDAELYASYEDSGKDIPISVIYEISGKFGVDFNDIITGTSAKLDTFQVIPNGKGRPVDRVKGYSFMDLAYGYGKKVMQPLLVTLEPSENKPTLITHSGQEFNMVLEGSVILMFDDKQILLETGDSVYFNPSHPHGQMCAGDKPAKFLTVITN